jgi:integrase
MARAAEGWQLYQHHRTGIYQVRFTHEGRRLNFSTGRRDSGPAAEEAARIYAEVVSGRWSPGRAVVVPSGKPFDEIAALWLADIEPTIDAKTFGIYRDIYVGKHIVPFFKTIDQLTTIRAEEYVAARLRKVTRHTVTKEISVLRRLAQWAHRRGYLDKIPEIQTPGGKVLGTMVEDARKRSFLVFTSAEMAVIIANLPEQAPIKSTGEKIPVRARFQVAWETSLRPATLDKLRVPENYRPGAACLTITDRVDKNRFRRELPISEAARKALDSVCPAAGVIFGAHDYRTPLRAAAKAAGIDAFRADRISPYDFRHSRLTHLGQVTSNLSGIMFIAGHRQPSTTAKYMRPQKAAAEEVLRAAAGLERGALWRHTGDTPKNRNGSPSENVNDSAVELNGIEPSASRVRF